MNFVSSRNDVNQVKQCCWLGWKKALLTLTQMRVLEVMMRLLVIPIFIDIYENTFLSLLIKCIVVIK